MRRKNILSIILSSLFVTAAFGAEPTKQSSNIVVSNAQCKSVRLDWTAGDGAWRIVVVKEGSAVDAAPVDGVKYTSNNWFKYGTQMGTGNYVVFSNITTSVIIDSLKQNTTYHVAIYEHDGANAPDYLTASPATISFTTKDLKLGFTYSYTDSCQNSNVISFKNTTQTNLSGITYTWTFKDGKKDTGFNVNHTYTQGGLFSVSVLALPSSGCANTYVSPKPVLIVPRPSSKPVEKNNKYNQCFSGHRFYFNDQTTLAPVPNCAYTRTWFFTQSDSSTIPTPDKIYKSPGIYRIFYKSETYYDNRRTGCTDTTSINVKVIADPSTGVTINDSIQCLAGNVFNFDNVYPGLVSFDWKFGDGVTASTKSASHTYLAVGNYPVIHEAASVEGCKSTDTSLVLVKPNFTATFSGLPKEICKDAPAFVLTPSTAGGKWIGVYNTDSLFIPSTTGIHKVKYLIPDTFCPDSIEQSIWVKPLPVFDLGPNANLCNGNTLDLEITAPGKVLWSDGNTLKKRPVNIAGTYQATVTDSGCSWTDDITLFIGNSPVINLPSDTLLCKGTIVRLAASWPGSTVLWSNGSRDTVIYVSSQGTYSVTVSNPCGSATDDVTIRYQGEFCDVFIPDAFTPNGDNKNEFFEIQGRAIVPVLFQVYDRWGAKVFDSQTDGGFKWDGNHDGEPCMDGMYSYIFRYQVISGDIKRRSTIKGSVLLYR
ncbi:MAG: PKD domain-containing protein [Bacteroidota bacterium]|jgi:gliding motility-associated-like protein